MAKDRKIDMVILGLLAHENMTGYDIKKQIDASISFFWKGSFGSIYPALASLEKMELIKKVPSGSAQSKRERIVYGITDNGLEYLKKWLSDSKSVNDMRYEMLLKVFFGGAADVDVSIATIEAFESEIYKNLMILKMYKENLAKKIEERDHIYFYLTVVFGMETYEGYLRWCKEAKEILSGKK